MIKNPLIKRFPRELKEEFGKYLVIFLFILGMIGSVSGFLVASDSMIKAYKDSFDKYKIEDGNFELASEADSSVIQTLEEEKVTIYPNYYIEETTKEVDSTLRIFRNREEINLVSILKGKFPAKDDEIAIDRMYADNNALKVGDSLTVGGRKLTITGLVALSDYSSLFSDTSDLMFDAVKFGVAVMTTEGFETYGDTHLHYSYSWVYEDTPKDEKEAKRKSDDFLKVLCQTTMVTNYIPEYSNQAIHLAGTDLGSDSSAFTAFLYILIIIIAFVFAITTSNTITKEASVIGTLRASGYTRGEIIRHYLAMPILVLLVAALIGNVLGYTLFKEYFVDMYYGTYSLPTYITIWNADALIKTTVIPLIILFLINLIYLVRKMSLSPLSFLRRDLKKRRKKKAFRLNTKIRFMTRFRIRIIVQNMPNYITIFVGILLANFLLLFGLMFLPLIRNLQTQITSNMICDQQYILKTQVETTNPQAEKYSLLGLKTEGDKRKSEEVTIYGISKGSDYVNLDFDEAKVYLSDAYANKYDIRVGDTITLEKQYEEGSYDFTVDGIYEYPSSIAIFLDRSNFNQIFGYPEDYYNGYFSNEELADIDERCIATKITIDDLTKTSRQLELSMGSMMSLFLVFGVSISMLIIYLLSKIIIEKNANSISMVKILGYDNREINRLYVMATSVVVILSIFATAPICYYGLGMIVDLILMDYSGYFPYYIPAISFVKMFALGIGSYLIIAFVQMRKVRKISMSDALKNVE